MKTIVILFAVIGVIYLVALVREAAKKLPDVHYLQPQEREHVERLRDHE